MISTPFFYVTADIVFPNVFYILVLQLVKQLIILLCTSLWTKMSAKIINVHALSECWRFILSVTWERGPLDSAHIHCGEKEVEKHTHASVSKLSHSKNTSWQRILLHSVHYNNIICVHLLFQHLTPHITHSKIIVGSALAQETFDMDRRITTVGAIKALLLCHHFLCHHRYPLNKKL